MKNILFVSMLMLIALGGFGQSIVPGPQQYICFDYDNAGNRIKRYECWVVPPKEEPDKGRRLAKKENSLTPLIAFPNPNYGLFKIKNEGISLDAEVKIYDALGKMVFQRKFEDGQFNVRHLAAGTYVVFLYDQGKTRSARIIKTWK